MKTLSPRRHAVKASIAKSILVACVGAALATGCANETPQSLVASAKQYLEKKDDKGALIQLRNALQKDPDYGEGRFLLGKVLLQGGNVTAAEVELRRAQKLGYSTDEVAPYLAQATLMTGGAQKVLDEFASVQIADPKGRAELQATLGYAYLGKGDRESAAKAFEQALAAKANYAPALLGQAQLKAQAGDVAGAITTADSALAESAGLPGAWQLKGSLLLAQGKRDQAVAAFKRALDVAPQFYPAHASLVTVMLQDGKLEDAQKQLEQLRKIAPNHPQTFHFTALLNYRQRNYVAAREAVQQELRYVPDNTAALALSAAIDLELRSYAAAEQSLLTALQNAPDELSLRRLLIATYLRSGQPIKAMEALKPVMDKVPGNSDMLAIAGEVYMANGQAAKAQQYLEQAVALDPENGAKRTAAALMQVARGDRDKGMQELEKTAASAKTSEADLALIAANVQRRDYDKALVAISALEKKQPTSPVPRALEAGAKLAKNDVAGARDSYQRALDLDAAYSPAAINLARLDIAENKPEEAKKRLEGFLQKNPQNLSALLALAELQQKAGAPVEEVAATINKAIAAKPNEPAPRIALMNLYLQRDPSKALSIAQDGLAAVGERPEMLDALGAAQIVAGRHVEAIATYEKLAKVQPTSPLPYVRMATINETKNDLPAAIQAYKRALGVRPNLVDAQRGLAGVYLKSGKLQDAIDVSREVQKQRPTEAAGYVLEGDIRASRKEWPEAVAAYRAGVKQSDATPAAIKLYSGLNAAGQAAEAEAFTATWLKAHPQDHNFRFYLAQLALAKKDYPKALTLYKAVLIAQPENPRVLNNAAWVAGQVKDAGALEYAKKAHELSPYDPVIMDTYGMLLFDSGDTKRGADLVKQAVGRAPDNPGIRLDLARVLAKSGDKAGAKKELEELAKLGERFPDQAEVAALMKTL